MFTPKTKVAATFKCKVCGEQGEGFFETTDPPGANAFLPELPEGWKHSYGASGRGQYFQCPKCFYILIDDSGKHICYDHSYYSKRFR